MLKRWTPIALVVAVFLNSLWWSSAIVFDGAPEYEHVRIPSFYVHYGRLPVFLKDPFMGKTCRANGVDCGASYSTLANYGYLINALTMKFVPATLVPEEYVRGRIGSAIMAVLFFLAVWGITKRIFPKDPQVFWATVFVSVSVPMFTFVSSYINSDIAGLLSNILVFWFSWEVVNRKRLDVKLLVAGGLATGLLLLSRINQYPMLLLVPWSFLVRWQRYKLSLKSVCLEAALVAVTAAVESGWWFLRNWILYRDPTGGFVIWKLWWTFSTRLNPQQMGLSPLTLLFGHIYGRNWLWTSFASFFGSFGYMTIWYPKWVYLVIVGLTGLAMVGVVGQFRRTSQKWKPEWMYEVLFWVGVGVVVVATMLLSAWTSWANEFQPQGRYWFAFYYPFALMLAYGLANLFSNRKWKFFSVSILVALFVVANVWGRWLIIVSGGGA